MAEAEGAAARLMRAMDTTWPAAERILRDGWVLRRGLGGGQRVSAASPAGADGVPPLAPALAVMADWGQEPIFRVAPGEEPLDRMLAEAGYAVRDPVVIYAVPVATLADARDETARIIRVSTAVALVEEIWDAGGIGPGRRAVMARAAAPRIVLMVRLGDRPVGCAFVACDGDIAMIHAIEVLAPRRREGAGRDLLHGAANWAAEQGAATLALAVTERNAPACALYDRLGMRRTARYHYRVPSA